MADKLTITMELEDLGDLELGAEFNIVDNLEKVPAIAASLAQALIQKLEAVLESGETSGVEHYSSKEEN